jgi:hypothetical protein
MFSLLAGIKHNKTKKPNRSTCKYKWEITGYLDNLNKPVTPSNQPIYKVQRVAGEEIFQCNIF